MALMIVVEGVLSFLGLSVPPPTPSWGGMIAAGREVLGEAPHVCLIPAAVLFLTVLSLNILGDTLRGRTRPL
jgi:peptide/nickel transport system permease protein